MSSLYETVNGLKFTLDDILDPHYDFNSCHILITHPATGDSIPVEVSYETFWEIDDLLYSLFCEGIQSYNVPLDLDNLTSDFSDADIPF